MSGANPATFELFSAGRYEECIARLDGASRMGWTDAACIASALAETGRIGAAQEFSRSFVRLRPVPADWHGLFALVTLGEEWLHPGANGALALPGGHNNMLELICANLPIKLLWLEQLAAFRPQRPCTILNLISDPDQHASGLKIAAELEDDARFKFINRPSACLKSDRQSVSQKMMPHPDVVIPETLRIDSSSAVEAALQRIGLPAILRPSGNHTGEGVHLIRNREDSHKVSLACADDCYLTQYVDFRREPAHFVKLRAYAIGPETLIEHVYVSHKWLVHARSLSRSEGNLVQLAHQYFLKMQDKIGVISQIMDGLRDTLGLDVFIADLGLLPDDRFVLFEANAVFSAILPHEFDEPIYFRAAAARIRDRMAAYVGGLLARQSG